MTLHSAQPVHEPGAVFCFLRLIRRYFSGGDLLSPNWLTTNLVLGNFDGKVERYRQFVNDALTAEVDSPFKQVIASTILGSPDSVREISQQHLGEKQADRNIPAVRVTNRPGVEEIIKAVLATVKDEGLARKASIYYCHRYSGARLREIGGRFGLSDAAVTQASRRMRVAWEKDAALQKVIAAVEERLKKSVVEI
jgi:putative transposase